MKPATNSTLLWILFAFSVVLTLIYGSWGVLESSEARYAEIGREMLNSGDLLHPRLLGIFHFHKPPVTYIITALGLKLFGINPFGARFFLMFAFLIQIYIVYRIAKIIFGGSSKPLYAAIIYSSFPIVLISVMNLTTDAFLNTFELISVFYIIRYYKEKRINFLYWFCVFISLAFLTKGPVGLIVPVLVLIACKIIYGSPKIKWKLHLYFSFLIFMLISFSWFIYLIIENSEFFDYFFFRHTVQRISDASVFERSEPWWYYLVFMPVMFIPWSVLLIKKVFEKRTRKNISSWRILYLFWIILPIFFFSLNSSKLILYILPLFPGIALFCGWILDELQSSELKFWTRIFLYIYIVLYSFMLLSGILFSDIKYSVLLYVIPILLILISLWINYSNRSFPIHKILLHSITFSIGIFLFASVFLKNNELTSNGTKPLVQFLKNNDLSDRQIIAYDRRLPSLSFHLNKDIISIHDKRESLNREIQFEKDDSWKNNLINVEETNKDSILNFLLQKESVLIYKNEAPEKIFWLSNAFNTSINLGDWFICYNK
ncbi:ArnT family glycosyltransferase [Bacteroidota bacterium]